jgi:hypothetical protein
VIDERLYSIVKIESYLSEKKDVNGNGVLVAPNLILTPYHVIKKEINNKEALKVIFPVLEDRCESVIDIINPNEELDIALLKIENHVQEIPLVELGYFPFGSMYVETLGFQSIGYMSDNWNKDCWVNGTINNPNCTETWDLELSAPAVSHDIRWKGYSGAPVFVRHKCFAIVIYKVDPHLGIPLGAISIEKLATYLENNGIQFTAYTDHEMLEKDECLTRLLDSAYNLIQEKDVQNLTIKEFILKRTQNLIAQIKEKSVRDFEMIINSIKTPFSQVFRVDDGKPSNIKLVSEVLIQLVLMKACKGTDFSYEKGRSLKLEKGYISYLYSSQEQSYKAVLLDLYKALMDEPLDKIDEIACVIIGNELAICNDRCSTPFTGASFDMEPIIRNIAKGSDRGELARLTNLVPKLDRLPHHCKYCLNYWDADSLGDINTILDGIVKE